MTFDQFMEKVDAILRKETGFTSNDLPDYCFYDCWQNGMSPKQTAKKAIKYAKEY